ncbi:hypothetical protein ACSQ67_010811 [Phaseolus vulgaris]
MKPQFNVAVALLISLLCIQHSFCDEPSDTGPNKWKCRCSSLQGKHIYSPANCSKSCDCHSDAEESASIWTCLCDSNGFPEVSADGHNLNCFKACNCTWGTVRMPLGSKKQISSKIVVVILSVCLTCTTIAFLASVVCQVCRRERCPIQSPMISSDKETSYSSTTNLISHKTSSPVSHITGCFQKSSLLFGSQRQTFYGNIIQFSFAELENATEKFSTSNLTGLGGSSYVYRGRLKDGSNVAVKRLKDQTGPEADYEFLTEITDLGMAKSLRADDHPSRSDSPARMQGTFGYFAPEYAIVGRASLESDVFSFGVVLLELISGRQPIHKSAGKEQSLVIWATPRLKDSRRVITELADPQLKGNFPEEELHIMAYLAKECLLLDPDTRPTMTEVVQILSSISPDRSRRRRNIPVSRFQEPEDLENQRQAPSSIFPTCDLLPLGVDNNLNVGNENKDAHAVSSEHMESLILFSPKGERWHASEEEMVDLTEPRFESFFMTNPNFP